ncbi:hypothetical protein LV89_02303 [Arcicella aurantiaca]|uniref:DNA-directed RNA polymerase specialized sigma24 family protein n=1 Tax=Arcicella aurantiaca TaxID=591202 RepID=A0A316EUB4_9BACT|nr:hypothetical protein [Arcicella aurantiaca]PWK26794.1 hypothetical protein LV89_02303 [Arcicella aurantiaca]
MNEFAQLKGILPLHGSPVRHEVMSLYDAYSSIAYGVILQILPQENLAQETLVNLFTTLSVQECKNCQFGSAIYIIRKARTKAIEIKNKNANNVYDSLIIDEKSVSEMIFELSFRQGQTPEVIAQRLNIPKAQVLKEIYEYFKSFRQSN